MKREPADLGVVLVYRLVVVVLYYNPIDIILQDLTGVNNGL